MITSPKIKKSTIKTVSIILKPRVKWNQLALSYRVGVVANSGLINSKGQFIYRTKGKILFSIWIIILSENQKIRKIRLSSKP